MRWSRSRLDRCRMDLQMKVQLCSNQCYAMHSASARESIVIGQECIWKNLKQQGSASPPSSTNRGRLGVYQDSCLSKRNAAGPIIIHHARPDGARVMGMDLPLVTALARVFSCFQFQFQSRPSWRLLLPSFPSFCLYRWIPSSPCASPVQRPCVCVLRLD